MIEGRRGRERLGAVGFTALAGSDGMSKELVDDCAEGRFRESFFMLRRERGLLLLGELSAESTVEADMTEVSFTAREEGFWRFFGGIASLRPAGGPFLRGMVDIFSCTTGGSKCMCLYEVKY